MEEKKTKRQVEVVVDSADVSRAMDVISRREGQERIETKENGRIVEEEYLTAKMRR